MRRPKLPLLAVLPLTVIALVVAVPLTLGSYPLRWQAGEPLPRLVVGGPPGPGAGSARPGAAQSPAATATAAAPAHEHVAEPWRPGLPQWGVQVYWEDDPGTSAGLVREQAWRLADYLVGLRANAVAVTFPFSTGGVTSDRVHGGPRTPSPARLGAVLDVFRQAGLRTTVRPILDERSLGGLPNWRGSIRPAHLAAWFASYQAFLVPYLRAAQAHGAAEFTIGAELSSLEGRPGWNGLVAAAVRSFTREIGYDADWDSYVKGPVRIPVRRLGVDAYFPVDAPDSASVATLVRGWNTWLDRKSAGALPRVVLSEVGIAAMTGAYAAPGDFYHRRAAAPAVQANWYTAVCQVVRQRRMGGVYWWFVNFGDRLTGRAPADSSLLDFAGRPRTEQAIRACFGSSYPGPGAAEE